ncbi:MAG: DUF4845 domain-containing protein [Thiohalomonadales bacterium]
MNNFRQRQSGITAISLLVILAVVVFFVMIGFSVVPVYMENFKVKSHLSKMEEESSLEEMSDAEIIDTLFRRFQIDNVDSVAKQDVSILRGEKSTEVNLNYEVYAPFLSNIEIVFAFKEKVTVPN